MVSERMEGDQLSPTEFKGGGGISCRQRRLGGGEKIDCQSTVHEWGRGGRKS